MFVEKQGRKKENKDMLWVNIVLRVHFFTHLCSRIKYAVSWLCSWKSLPNASVTCFSWIPYRLNDVLCHRSSLIFTYFHNNHIASKPTWKAHVLCIDPMVFFQSLCELQRLRCLSTAVETFEKDERATPLLSFCIHRAAIFSFWHDCKLGLRRRFVRLDWKEERAVLQSRR